MSNLWERFDTIATPDEVVEASSQFKPIDAGTYEAVLEEIKAGESKDGLPMLTAKFRTLENRVIFHNILLQNVNYPNMTAVNIAQAVEMLSALRGEELVFEGLAKLAETVEATPTGKSYYIKVSYATKDIEMKYPKIKVEGGTEVSSDGEIPF